MTHKKDFKQQVRGRMRATGENYTAALTALNALPEPPLDRFYQRTVAINFDGERLRRIPTKRRARVVILLELLKRLDPDYRYTERELATILTTAHEDHASIRREMVDYGYLTRDDRHLWVSKELRTRTAQEAQEVPTYERQIFAALRAGRTAKTPDNSAHRSALFG